MPGADVDEVVGHARAVAVPRLASPSRARAARRRGSDARRGRGHRRRRRAHPRPHRGDGARGPAARRAWPSGRSGSSAALAEVEGRLHRRPPDQVHFHEVGSHDTIVDVVGTAAALEVLGVDEVTASSVATGTGTVRSAHGFLPNPSPAVVELLRGAPTWGRDIAVELTTPTGAAILSALASRFGPLPPMRIESSGFGAGTNGDRRLAQLHAGRDRGGRRAKARWRARRWSCSRPTSTMPPARCSPTPSRRSSRLGAYDAWITPVLMKKGRPGHTVSALVDPALGGLGPPGPPGRDRHASGSGVRPSSGGPRRGPWTRSTSRGSRCG